MAIAKAGSAPLGDLAEFLKPYGRLVRRAESRRALERYTTGLLSDVPQKNVSALGRVLPGTNGQCLQEFLTRTGWDAAGMDRLRIRDMLARASAGGGVLIADDTGFAKKGKHSVGVARQYSGTLGRIDNCQVLVTLHYVDRVFDWPVSGRLYLPEIWAKDRGRRRTAQVPEEVEFQTKGSIALDLIDSALGEGLRPRAVVVDAGYGDQPAFLDGLEGRQLPYAASLKSTVRFRPAEAVDADPGTKVRPPYQGHGRPRRPQTLEARVPAEEVAALLGALPEEAWRTVAWRQATKGPLVKQFARVRAYRVGRRGRHLPASGWLLFERPLPGHRGETRAAFLWGLEGLALEEGVELVHQRWVIERFYQDAKGELGLDDYAGRLWAGFHRHVALVMLAHSYLTLRQSYGSDVLEEAPKPGADPDDWTRSPRRRAFPPTGTKKHRRTPAGHSGSALSPGPRLDRPLP